MNSPFNLDGFEPIKRVGGGGFGDVWLARQLNVDREVAIKVGHAPIQDETIRLRFDRECKALGRLSGHPNIVDVFTAGSLKDGRPYLVLEYIDGGTLWHRLKKERVEEAELIRVGHEIAGALDKAHSSGILHRDLKPENILMRSTGEAVLGDFGIARLQDGANTTSAAITASVAYAAPEVLGGTKASVASDIYGVGICLLAAVIRSVPFVEKNDDSIHPIINRVLSDAPPAARSHGISDPLAETIEWTLSKKPDDRPGSATELVDRFQELSDGMIATRVGSGQRITPVRRRPTADVGAGARNVSLADTGRTSEPGVTIAQKHFLETPMPAAPEIEYTSTSHDRRGSASLDRLSHHSQEFTPGVSWRQNESVISSGSLRSASIRAFAIAYAGTVVVGGGLAYLLTQVLA